MCTGQECYLSCPIHVFTVRPPDRRSRRDNNIIIVNHFLFFRPKIGQEVDITLYHPAPPSSHLSLSANLYSKINIHWTASFNLFEMKKRRKLDKFRKLCPLIVVNKNSRKSLHRVNWEPDKCIICWLSSLYGWNKTRKRFHKWTLCYWHHIIYWP